MNIHIVLYILATSIAIGSSLRTLTINPLCLFMPSTRIKMIDRDEIFHVESINWIDTSILGTTSNASTIITTSSIIEIPILDNIGGVCYPFCEQPIHMIMMNARQLINDILSDKNKHANKLFGITQSDPENTTILCEIGTMLENESVDMMADGSQCTYNKCRNRFKILKILKNSPYTVAVVQYPYLDIEESQQPENALPSQGASGFAVPTLEVFDLEKTVWNLFNVLSTSILQYARISTDILPHTQYTRIREYAPTALENTSRKLSDSVVFSYLLSDVLALTGEERQRLLSASSLKIRLELLRAHLYKTQSFLSGTA